MFTQIHSKTRIYKMSSQKIPQKTKEKKKYADAFLTYSYTVKLNRDFSVYMPLKNPNLNINPLNVKKNICTFKCLKSTSIMLHLLAYLQY